MGKPTPHFQWPYAEKTHLVSTLHLPESLEEETVPMEEMPVLSEAPETNEAEVVEAPLEVLLDAKKPLKIFTAVSHIFFWRFGKKIIFLSFDG